MWMTASATIESSPRSMIVSVSGTRPASEFSIGSTARSTSPLVDRPRDLLEVGERDPLVVRVEARGGLLRVRPGAAGVCDAHAFLSPLENDEGPLSGASVVLVPDGATARQPPEIRVKPIKAKVRVTGDIAASLPLAVVARNPPGSEDALLARLVAQLAARNPAVELGIGDDAAVLVGRLVHEPRPADRGRPLPHCAPRARSISAGRRSRSTSPTSRRWAPSRSARSSGSGCPPDADARDARRAVRGLRRVRRGLRRAGRRRRHEPRARPDAVASPCSAAPSIPRGATVRARATSSA